MPALANLKHEAFAQAVVSGCSLTEAARRSGHTDGHGNFGSRLAKLVPVQQRILELQAGSSEPSENAGETPRSAAPSQDVLVYTSKPWVTVELVAVHNLARKARDYGVCHSVLRTLAQLGGHLDGNRGVSANDPARLTLMGVAEIHQMLKQTLGGVPAADRRKLLAESPELAEIVAEAGDAEPAINDITHSPE